MGDSEVQLSERVEMVIRKICLQKQQAPPDNGARLKLAAAGDDWAFDVVRRIFNSQKPIKNLSSYIVWMVDHHPESPTQVSAQNSPLHSQSPLKRASSSSSSAADVNASTSSYTPSALSPRNGENCYNRMRTASRKEVCRRLFDENEIRQIRGSQYISDQLMILSELEFRKLFLVLSYIARQRLEEVISVNGAKDILNMKDLPMGDFESQIWSDYGKIFCKAVDRREYIDWDSGKTHLYYCDVYQDGSYSFKGPSLDTTKTHLQRALGDENVLIVKFVEDCTSWADKIVREGIVVGLRRYRFFAFKGEGKAGKKKERREMDKAQTSGAIKCYFVRFDSIAQSGGGESYVLSSKKINEARCLFMHVHMVSSMAKYMARFSLILSKTIKLPVDFSTVKIERIEDIPCQDEHCNLICDEDGEPLILTDGTGFISEDLALNCPRDFGRAKFVQDRDFQKFRDFIEFEDGLFQQREVEHRNKEPPLLMQCRLFSNGCAVKGTLLVNRKLASGTIQIRPSMVKVERDFMCPVTQTFNSLEIVAVSNKPRRTYLSRYLIALLSYGGLPRSFFLDILARELEETQAAYSNKRAALKVAIVNGEVDDEYTTARMLCCGVPLNEPHLQGRLPKLVKAERTHLEEGKLPISESFYLMGTADPTGELNSNQVCVILDNGQISGKVLVYRNPGLHFGDIHILEAVYVKNLENIIGNAKYGIFFSTKGRRSAASEIANGDFDGDMYWVSRNPQLLKYFKASEPWSRVYSTPHAINQNPREFSPEELENELFQLFLKARKPSFNMSLAADSWLAFMDQLLILGDDPPNENDELKKKMLKLVDIYYDALDAPKSGKKVNVPAILKADKYPHYMGRGDNFSYHSTSILGDIYDKNKDFQSQEHAVREIWKLPCFEMEVPGRYLSLWEKRYTEYRYDMQKALQIGNESRNSAADEVIKKYKRLLYEAEEFHESKKDAEEIYNEALAIYHVCYDHAISKGDVAKCGFAWKVAGCALCSLHAFRCNQNPIRVLPSILRDLIM